MFKLQAGMCDMLTEDVVETLRKSKYMTVLDFITSETEKIAENTTLSILEVISIRRILLAKYSAKLLKADNVYRGMLMSTGGMSTGIDNLDTLLDGGIICGEIVEFYGASASGKTQVCFHISAHVAVTTCQPILFIDTCGSFSSQRIQQIMIANRVTEQDSLTALSRMSCLSCFNVYELFAVLDGLLEQKINSNGTCYKLIIIDSVAAVLLPLLGGQTMEGHGLMNRMANKLKMLAVHYSKAILITNHQVQWEENQPRPSLGKYWAHVPNIRVKLSLVKSSDLHSAYRLIEITKSVRTVTGQMARIKLTTSGVQCEP